MKKLILFSAFLVSLNTLAETGRTGIGVSVGNPTGVNGKYWLNDSRAVDAGLGASIGKDAEFNLYSDYLIHEKQSLYFNNLPLDLYYGIGGRLEFDENLELGARVPVGLIHIIDSSYDLFGEVAPVLDIIGKVGLEFNLMVGARWYFR